MPRVKRGASRRQKRKKILARAKGYYQAKSKLYRYAKEAVDRGLKFAYIGRRLKKRDFRSLWIIRIAAGARQHGISYSRFMHGLKLDGIEINRKMLAEMAVRDPDAFGKLAAQVSRALEAPRAKQPEAARSPVGEPAATEAEAKGAESPAPVAEAAPAKVVKAAAAAPAEAVKAAAAGAQGVGQAAAVPAQAVEVEVKETAESPPAEAKPAKKAASKTVPEEESSVSGAAPKATKPAVKPATAAKKKTSKPAAKTSAAAKPPKSSAGAKKKAAKPSKATRLSKGSKKPFKTTASD